MLNIISLGAGVQSTTLLLMAAQGKIGPMPDAAIFADTQWEPKAVYRHLAWLKSQAIPFPIYQVSAGNLRADILSRSNTSGGRFAAVPWHMVMPNGSTAIGRRQCTQEYKLKPIRQKVRALLGDKTPKGGAQIWIGISLDEAMRMKPSKIGYMVNRWPLIELRMTRRDCLQWLTEQNYPQPPKSSCIGCPYHSNSQWRDIKRVPDEWQDALTIDAAIRDQPKMKGQQFAHHSKIPLADVDLSTAEERGQLNLFNNDCEGMCGV